MKRKDLLSVRFTYFSLAFGTIFTGIMFTALVTSWGTVWFYVLIGLLVLVIGLLIVGYHYIWKPYYETTQMLGYFATRPSWEEIRQLRWPYNEQMQLAIDQFKKYIEKSTSLEMSKRQAQYLALQNQINPHFLYNTLESIRSEALMSGLSSVAEMCEALANYFRYTISNMNDLVTLEEEIQNIQTYFYIQQYRFGNRIHLNIQWDENDRGIMLKCMIPKLTLQPIVENAIIHGIEQKIGEGTVTIRMMLTQRRLIINVLDDGNGMSKEIIEKINRHMGDSGVNTKGKGGIAIANVNNRIKILFGDLYGVTVFSTVGVGTDVEITLPRTTKQKRNTF